MIKAAILGVMGFLGATLAFALANGISEYQTALSSRTYTIIDGVERDLTSEELRSSFLIGDTIRTLPFGLIVAGALSIPLFFVARSLRSVSRLAAYFFGGLIGAVAGIALSIVTWILFGGWGPPFLLPAMVCGIILAVAWVEVKKAAGYRPTGRST
jgi:hypothetical protein